MVSVVKPVLQRQKENYQEPMEQKKALVNISNNMADIEYDEKEIKASEIMKIIEKLGYTPKRREDLKDKEEAIRAEKMLKIRINKIKNCYSFIFNTYVYFNESYVWITSASYNLSC